MDFNKNTFMISCPRCEEDLEESAIICKYCGCNVNRYIEKQNNK